MRNQCVLCDKRGKPGGCLSFHRKDQGFIQTKVSGLSKLSTATSFSGLKGGEIVTMDTVDQRTKIIFQKYFQRKVKGLGTVVVVTLQDVKDVAIFTTKIDALFPEFISFFHTVSMDRFLRSMIIYFQYYLQVWRKMQSKQKENTRKLRQPIVTELENEVRDNLADLRSMVSRDYAAILMGIGDSSKFHHMSNKDHVSMSDKDRRKFEMLIFMTTKVVWIGLFRKNLTLIDKEINRLLRTCNYSSFDRSGKGELETTKEEQRVLLGRAFKNEKKLLHKSPAIQEIILDDHDYRLLSIGINNIPGGDDRIRYLEIAYSCPEELLVGSGIAVGVLGVERRFLDSMLKPKDISTTLKRMSVMKIGKFKMPPKSSIKDRLVSDTLPKTPSKFQETDAAKQTRHNQCKKWRAYFESFGTLPDMTSSNAGSVSTFRTSIAPKENPTVSK